MVSNLQYIMNPSVPFPLNVSLGETLSQTLEGRREVFVLEELPTLNAVLSKQEEIFSLRRVLQVFRRGRFSPSPFFTLIPLLGRVVPPYFPSSLFDIILIRA